MSLILRGAFLHFCTIAFLQTLPYFHFFLFTFINFLNLYFSPKKETQHIFYLQFLIGHWWGLGHHILVVIISMNFLKLQLLVFQYIMYPLIYCTLMFLSEVKLWIFYYHNARCNFIVHSITHASSVIVFVYSKMLKS